MNTFIDGYANYSGSLHNEYMYLNMTLYPINMYIIIGVCLIDVKCHLRYTKVGVDLKIIFKK
jgi:hypothetical protein